MIGRVSLGGQWWAHIDTCTEVDIGPHVHYGNGVIVSLMTPAVPEHVRQEYHMLLGNPDVPPPRGVLNATD